MDIATARRRARRTRSAQPRITDDDYFQFEGGLNRVDPPLAVRPGHMIECLNYEPGIRGGYERTGGFREFDGQQLVAPYTMIDFDGGIVANYPAAGTTVHALASALSSITVGAVEDSDSDGLGSIPVDTVNLGGSVRDNDLLVVSEGTEQFSANAALDDAAWSLTGATVTADQRPDPINNATVVDLLDEDASTGLHYISQSVGSFTAGVRYVISAFVRVDGTGRNIGLRLWSTPGADRVTAQYDIGGFFPSVAVGPTLEGSYTSAEAGVVYFVDPFINDNWYFVYLSAVVSAGTALEGWVNLVDPNQNLSYAGTAGSGNYVWNVSLRRYATIGRVKGAQRDGETNAVVNFDGGTVANYPVLKDVVRFGATRSGTGTPQTAELRRVTDPNSDGIGSLTFPTLAIPDLPFNPQAAGTVLDNDYLHVVGEQEFFSNTQALQDSDWTKTNCTINTNDINDPNGNLTADKIEETAVSGEHRVSQSEASFTASVRYIFSFFLRPDERTEAVLTLFNAAGQQAQVTVNLTAGTVGTPTVSGLFTAAEAGITPSVNGWFWVFLSADVGANTGSLEGRLALSNSGATSYLGVVGEGLHAWDGSLRRDMNGLVGRVVGTQISVNSVPADTDTLDAAYRAAAQLQSVTQIPGSGSVLGVVVYKGSGYAFKNNAGGTATDMFRSGSSGWVQVTLGRTLDFDAGTTAFAEGETLTGGTSGATGTVRRVIVQSGDWGTNDADGYVVLSGVTGTFQNNETITTGGGGSATADGADAAITIQPNGKYDFRVWNFGGHAGSLRLYGASGVDNAFEFDDTNDVYTPIRTGMTTDTPNHVAVHRNYLYLSFAGGSIQRSGLGTPLVWTVVTGAAEIGIGDECTGFLEEIGKTLFIFSRHKTFTLTDTGSLELDEYSIEAGAVDFSVQRIGQGMYADDRGLTTLSTTQRSGNYLANTYSDKVLPLLEEIGIGNIQCSVIARCKNLYRVFFSDGRFLSVGVRARGLDQAESLPITGITVSNYGKVVTCAFSGEASDGTELLLFGTTDGAVYQADASDSFDGLPISTICRLVFHHSGSPGRNKRYRFAQLDVRTLSKTTLELRAGVNFNAAVSTGVANINVPSANVLASPKVKLEKEGQNIQLLITHSRADERSHTLHGAVLTHSARRIVRRASQ